MAKNLSMAARTGRDKQRYSETGARLVAGIVPLSSDLRRVLLIESTRRGGWVLPKGGWETDEATAQEAAKREAWEEAGVVVTITRDLGRIADPRSSNTVTPGAPKAEYLFFEAKVEREMAEWPEKSKRGRKWVGWKEAVEMLGGRRELVEALEKSAIVR